jgi:hypothetical protein
VTLVEALKHEGTDITSMLDADEHARRAVIQLYVPNPLQAAQASSHWARLALAQRRLDVDNPVAVLARQVHEDNRRRDHPWIPTWDLIGDALSSLATYNREQLQQLFADEAKAHRIGAEDAVLLQSLLFFDESERLAWAAALLVHRSSAARAQLFNRLVASQARPGMPDPDAFVRERGAILVAANLPLWPRDIRFRSLTADFLAFFGGGIVGGGEDDTPRAAGFGEGGGAEGPGFGPVGTMAAAGLGVSVTGGAPAQPHGRDTATMEREILSLRRQVSALERRLTTAGGEVRAHRGGGTGQ